MKLYLVCILLITTILLQCNCINNSNNKYEQYVDIENIAFVGANLIPMTCDTILFNYTILIKNGRIVQIEKSETAHIPSNFKQIDVTGKYMMPGFIDMHVHLSDDDDMLKFVQHGVTTVRNMSDVPWWTRIMGFSNILKLRKKQQERKIVGPDIYTCGYTLDGNPPISPMNKRIVSEQDAVNEVNKEKEAGYDAIKLYDNLSFDAYKGIVNEAYKVGMPVTGHVPHAVLLDTILKDRIVSIEHFTGYIDNKTADFSIHKNDIDKYLQLTKISGVYNVPTLAVWACMPAEDGLKNLKQDSRYKALSWHIKWMWKTALPYYYKISYPDKIGYTKHMLQLTQQFAYQMYKSGCPLLIGTDTNIAGTYVGDATLLEMELFVGSGIPIYETLRDATVLPAKALGKELEIGTLEVGKKANLIVLDKSPLMDIHNIRSLIWCYCNGYLIKP